MAKIIRIGRTTSRLSSSRAFNSSVFESAPPFSSTLRTPSLRWSSWFPRTHHPRFRPSSAACLLDCHYQQALLRISFLFIPLSFLASARVWRGRRERGGIDGEGELGDRQGGEWRGLPLRWKHRRRQLCVGDWRRGGGRGAVGYLLLSAVAPKLQVLLSVFVFFRKGASFEALNLIYLFLLSHGSV